MIGDAACFIDPVFSSGVHLATYSALLAARSINTLLANSLREELVFQEFEARYRREYRYFYEFLTSFYDLDQSLDSYYWNARVLLNSESLGNHAFLNLVGDASGELMGAGQCGARYACRGEQKTVSGSGRILGGHVPREQRTVGKDRAVFEGTPRRGFSITGAERSNSIGF